MDSRVRIEGAAQPSPAEALELYRAVFVGPGEYVVKAQTHDEDFEEWFLGALFRAAQRHYGDARAQIREALDRLLKLRGVKAPTGLGFDELHEALMDLSTASTASMVGIDVPQAVKRRLLTIGFTAQAILDFPAIAYRMGLIYRELASAAPVPFARLAARARAVPITDAENAAIDYARRRAGLWLRPIFDREGALWSAERELFPIRQRVTQALERRTAPREAARELQNTYRAAGIERDAERVIRTELAEASNRGAWAVESRTWSSDDQVFRQPSREACKGCLRLYLDPNGMPRLYAPRFVEEASAYPNTGGWRDWMPQIGPTHPNCFPAGTLVSALAGRPTRGYQRFYSGDLVTLKTKDGRDLSCTPNHPILTPDGWVAAGALDAGSNVISGRVGDRSLLRDVNHNDAPARIEDVLRALRESGEMSATPVPVSSEYFHGDGEGSEVAVVWADRLLAHDVNAARNQQIEQQSLVFARWLRSRLAALRTPAEFIERTLRAAHRGMGVGSVLESLRLANASIANALSLAAGPQFSAALAQATAHPSAIDSSRLSNREYGISPIEHLADRFRVYREGSCPVHFSEREGPKSSRTQGLGEFISVDSNLGSQAPEADPRMVLRGDLLDVEATLVVAVHRHRFQGYVYNLETPHHFYTANGVVVHNCVCGPWQRWQPAMTSIFERSAQSKLVTLRDLRVFEDSA